MKLIKIFLITILSFFIVLCVSAFLLIRFVDINKLLPQITREISASIHMPVDIARAHLGWDIAKGLNLILHDIKVSDTFVKVERVNAQVDIFALLKKQVHIIEVQIISPKIFIVQNNKEVEAYKVITPADSSKITSVVDSSRSKKSQQISLPEVLVKKISVINGELMFEDRSYKSPLIVKITDFKLAINNLSLTNPFDFDLSLNIFSRNSSNLTVTGNCRIDLSQESGRFSNLQIKTDLNLLDLIKVKEVLSAIQSFPIWPQEVKGSAFINIPTLTISAKGVRGDSLSFNINEGYIKLKEILTPISGVFLLAESNFKDLSIKQCQGHVGKGQISVEGEIKNLLNMPKYSYRIQTKGLKVHQLLDETSWPFVLDGLLEANISGAGESFDPSFMMQNLRFNGDFRLLDGKLEKFNILKMILDKLSFMPGISNQIESYLPSSIKEQLSSETTVLEKVDSKFNFQDKILNIYDTNVQSRLFSILTDGSIDTGSNVNLNIKTYLSTELSGSLVKSVNELKGLLDNQGRIYIPGKLSGQIPSVGYKPDVEYLTKNTVVSEGINQLEKVLDKNPKIKNILNAVLGGSNNQNDADETSNSTDPQNQTQEEPAKKLINNVLKGIF